MKRTTWEIGCLQIFTGTNAVPTATLRLTQANSGSVFERHDTATGVGPFDAICTAINRITRFEGSLEDLSIQSQGQRQTASGKATAKVRLGELIWEGTAEGADIMSAAAQAYLNAVNNKPCLRNPHKRENAELAEKLA